MPVPVLLGFTGVLVAAVATGMLAGLCVRQPRVGFVLTTASALGLTVALAAQSMGFAYGFGPVTFRAVQLSALLVVPLWLAWGLVELAAGETARFGMRLASGALTVVAGVIVATDPLTAQPFSKSWPLTGPHSQPVSGYALDAVQAVAVAVAVLTAALVAGRAWNSPRHRAMLAAIGPVALAVLMTAGLRLSFPARFAYPLLSMIAAVLVWFGVTRAQDLPGEEGRARGVRGADLGGADLGGPPYGPRGYPPDGRRGPGYPGGAGRDVPSARGRPQMPPAAQMAPGGAVAEGESGAPAMAAAPSARPYGRILIFTLLEDKVADFDRLADQAAEQVSTGEPDTLVYVIHLVPDAPLQRIFYEIYRDRAAFESHEGQPYMKRFVAERRSCVLATTVIELRLKYAKVAPLPNPQPGQGLPVGQVLPSAPLPPLPLPPQPQGPRHPRVPGPLPQGPPPWRQGQRQQPSPGGPYGGI